MSRITLDLYSPQQARPLLTDAWEWVKAQTMAGNRVQLKAQTETRSDKENRLLHALLGHISKTQDWAGKKRDIETWKRLLVAAWCRAKNEHVEILPAIDGHGVDIVFRKTSRLTIAECADLIEFIFAWAAMNGLQFPSVIAEEKLYAKTADTVKIGEPEKLLEQQCGL